MRCTPLLPPLLLGLLLAASPAPAAQAREERGAWTGEVRESSLQLSLHRKGARGQLGVSVPLSTLPGLDAKAQGERQLRLEREAGTLSLEGRFADGQGAGLYRFVPNDAFLTTMAGLGVKGLDEEDRLTLALFDVSSARVKALQGLGFRDLSAEDLVKAALFDVTPPYVQRMRALGYEKLTLDELVSGRIHGVTPEFIQRLGALGYRGLSLERLVEMRIHGVTPEFIQEMREAGYKALRPDQLVQLRIHGIDREFVRSVSGARGPRTEKAGKP